MGWKDEGGRLSARSCQKEGAGWVERAGGGFQKVNFEKKCVDKNERERERHRERCVKGCALGKEEGVRGKTKRVKMSSEKMAPFETVNFSERESERDSNSQPDTMTLKNKGKTIEFCMKKAKSVFEMKGFE